MQQWWEYDGLLSKWNHQWENYMMALITPIHLSIPDIHNPLIVDWSQGWCNCVNCISWDMSCMWQTCQSNSIRGTATSKQWTISVLEMVNLNPDDVHMSVINCYMFIPNYDICPWSCYYRSVHGGINLLLCVAR